MLTKITSTFYFVYSRNHFPPCSYLLLNSDDEEEDEEDYDSQEHLRRKEVKI
jgi:hypothetical protein